MFALGRRQVLDNTSVRLLGEARGEGVTGIAASHRLGSPSFSAMPRIPRKRGSEARSQFLGGIIDHRPALVRPHTPESHEFGCAKYTASFGCRCLVWK